MAQGSNGADCFRRELKNDRHPARKGGWGKLRCKHGKNEWGLSKCRSPLSSLNGFTIYRLVSGIAMLLTDPVAAKSKQSVPDASGICIRDMIDHVGLVGFEPTASWSRTRRSTKLSHSPKWNLYFDVRGRRALYFAYFAAYGKEIEDLLR